MTTGAFSAEIDYINPDGYALPYPCVRALDATTERRGVGWRGRWATLGSLRETAGLWPAAAARDDVAREPVAGRRGDAPRRASSRLPNTWPSSKLFAVSPEKGAETPIWVAPSRELDGVSGKYFGAMKEKDGKLRYTAITAGMISNRRGGRRTCRTCTTPSRNPS